MLFGERSFEGARRVAVGVRVGHHQVLMVDVQAAKAGRERHGHLFGSHTRERIQLLRTCRRSCQAHAGIQVRFA